MNFTITGKQMDVGDALRARTTEVLGQVAEKYFDRPIDASVTFTKVAHLFHANVSVHIGRGLDALGEGKADDAYHALELAVSRIDKQLRRYKRKLRDHHIGNGMPVEAVTAAQYILAGDTDDGPNAIDLDRTPDTATGAETPDGDPVVIAEMTTQVPTLAVSEAVMRLDLTGETAMMFRNQSHGGLNMLYRRRDGNIGWVDPDGVA